jgi:MFS superfamily sulfate permease-like transporter
MNQVWLSHKTNILAGITVAMALVPEALAFAIVAGVHPMAGLFAVVIVAFITSAFGGRPGMVSAAGLYNMVLSICLPQSLGWGLFSSLLVGKLIGIAFSAWLAVKIGLARLPEGVTMMQILGVSLLGGIGFTMSIFIAEIGFEGQAQLIDDAKLGILLASLLSGILGYFFLRTITKIRIDDVHQSDR